MEEDKKKQQKNLNTAEKAVGRAFTTGKADRAAITRMAQLDAAEAVARAGEAMESDAAADEAARLTVIATTMGTREKAKAAREHERMARDKAKEDHRAATKSAKKAYDAIRFSDPTKLGFLRVIQVLFLAHIITTLLILFLTSRDTVSYSSVNIIDWIMVVLESIAFYFIFNRFKVGKPFVIAIMLLGGTAHLISDIFTGAFVPLSSIGNFCYYLLIALYFLFSDRVKAVLVNEMSSDKGEDEQTFVVDRRSWPFYRNLIIYFVIFSVLGHWMEAAFCQLIRLGIVQGEFHADNTMLWRDWLYPYPMHGTAVILIALFLNPLFNKLKKTFKNRFAPYVVSFVINALICTLIEFCGGLMFNAQLQNWDYSNMPFNFMGQICLQNAIGFGVASSVIAWWLYPMMEQHIARVRPAIMNIVCVVVAIAGGILFSLYAISPPEGVDLGGHPNAERDALVEEVRGLETADKLLSDSTETLKKKVNESKSFTDEEKQEIDKHLNSIHTEMEGIDKVIENKKGSVL